MGNGGKGENCSSDGENDDFVCDFVKPKGIYLWREVYGIWLIQGLEDVKKNWW